ncbi:MAG: LemA family protein [Moraxella sp.]|nr:LemA family protein [Moraxella sp.]
MIVIAVILGVILVWFWFIYNGLVISKNQVKNALSQIDVQLKRRHDLIPNLVEVAKGYLVHEKATLENVINARNVACQFTNHRADDGEQLSQMASAENVLSGALARFYAVAENYPDLKADSVIKELFDELTYTENRIGFARQHYNDSVMSYNNRREIFPNNLISGVFGFGELFGLEFNDRSIKSPPTVRLG